ncbi:hypothetical protein BC834DRAFT_867970 [Gloeopeniophorella convolvens]|nr:hypothetical protein BC834DRAFT_867970 [Gloeopeniophorella convolvens]
MSTSRSVMCTLCNKPFSRRADLTRHLRLHAGDRPYECVDCGKRFAQPTALKTHSNVHTGSKPFKCGHSGCSASFGDPSSCTRHRREVHQPKQRFKCIVPGCTSSILRASAFRVHLKKHGLNPGDYDELFRQHRSSAELASSRRKGVRVERVAPVARASPGVQPPALPALPESWESLISFPEDELDYQGMQRVPSSEVFYGTSLPMNASYASTFQPNYDNGYLQLPPRAPSSAGSSQTSSPTPATPVLAPDTVLDFVKDVNVQLNSYVSMHDWTQDAWQDQGVGGFDSQGYLY